ncbi:hypothetical protein CTH30272_00096 [Allocatenococcus thiocycli]|nr:hypothetical protein CTH30272_00096 [Catenococcus thiocycli]
MKKISWYSRGDYTTGVKDTFACCRSGMRHATSGIHLRGRPLDELTIRGVTYFSYKNNDTLM